MGVVIGGGVIGFGAEVEAVDVSTSGRCIGIGAIVVLVDVAAVLPVVIDGVVVDIGQSGAAGVILCGVAIAGGQPRRIGQVDGVVSYVGVGVGRIEEEEWIGLEEASQERGVVARPHKIEAALRVEFPAGEEEASALGGCAVGPAEDVVSERLCLGGSRIGMEGDAAEAIVMVEALGGAGDGLDGLVAPVADDMFAEECAGSIIFGDQPAACPDVTCACAVDGLGNPAAERVIVVSGGSGGLGISGEAVLGVIGESGDAIAGEVAIGVVSMGNAADGGVLVEGIDGVGSGHGRDGLGSVAEGIVIVADIGKRMSGRVIDCGELADRIMSVAMEARVRDARGRHGQAVAIRIVSIVELTEQRAGGRNAVDDVGEATGAIVGKIGAGAIAVRNSGAAVEGIVGEAGDGRSAAFGDIGHAVERVVLVGDGAAVRVGEAGPVADLVVSVSDGIAMGVGDGDDAMACIMGDGGGPVRIAGLSEAAAGVIAEGVRGAVREQSQDQPIEAVVGVGGDLGGAVLLGDDHAGFIVREQLGGTVGERIGSGPVKGVIENAERVGAGVGDGGDVPVEVVGIFDAVGEAVDDAPAEVPLVEEGDVGMGTGVNDLDSIPIAVVVISGEVSEVVGDRCSAIEGVEGIGQHLPRVGGIAGLAFDADGFAGGIERVAGLVVEGRGGDFPGHPIEGVVFERDGAAERIGFAEPVAAGIDGVGISRGIGCSMSKRFSDEVTGGLLVFELGGAPAGVGQSQDLAIAVIRARGGRMDAVHLGFDDLHEMAVGGAEGGVLVIVDVGSDPAERVCAGLAAVKAWLVSI